MQNVSLAKIGGKGLFVKEIEESLLRRDIDLAVHSMKDMPVDLPDGLEIAITPKREDPRDVLISHDGAGMEAMPPGAHIGTGSLRRGVQIRNRMPLLDVVPIRGNLDTRIRKVTENLMDGVVVAAAGMKRMGWAGRISQYLPVELMLPAACQGILGLETRNGDSLIEDLRFIQDNIAWVEMIGERLFSSVWEAGASSGCRTRTHKRRNPAYRRPRRRAGWENSCAWRTFWPSGQCGVDGLYISRENSGRRRQGNTGCGSCGVMTAINVKSAGQIRNRLEI